MCTRGNFKAMIRASLASVLLLPFGAVLFAQDTVPRRLPAVVVTRDVQRSTLDLPFAITSLRPDSVAPGIMHTQVEQTLAQIPGLTIANRNNPSQDTRISIRGFGARSPFGIRSLKILRDGMPLTLPDGQTPLDYLDLEAVDRVETIRGSAAAMYGNASGGVIDLRSAAPPAIPIALQLRSWTGSNALRRYTGVLGGASGPFSYQGNIGRTTQDGFRAYSHQRLTNAFLRSSAELGGTVFTLVGLGLDMPVAENPGALTRVQFDTNPDMADPLSVSKLARKEVHQVQVSGSARRPLVGDGEAFMQVYGGSRSLHNPLTFSIVGVDRRSSGVSGRATIPARLFRIDQRFTIGIDAQYLNDARKNWANCNAVPTPTANCPTIGVERGVLTLDQREMVNSMGHYVRDELTVGPVRATLGARLDNTTFEVTDAFLTDGRNDSGKRRMRALSPMAGVAVKLTPAHAVYANASSAFETPTTTELGNQANGNAGFNPDLEPQYSTTYEVGAKGLALSRVEYDLSLYDTYVRDELIPFDIGNGRTAFRNAGRTRRRGVEIGGRSDVGPLTFAGSYTYSLFRFVEFLSGTTQMAGHTIPGIPERQLQTSVTGRVRRGFAFVEWIGKSAVQVNDANAAAAPGYALVNARIGATAAFGRPWLTPVVGMQNVFDRKYVGSVAVNAAGTLATAKFYEPGPGRTFFVGLSAGTAAW